MNSIQYTIRAVPQPLNKALRQHARQSGISLNQAIIDALRRGTGITNKPVVYHDLDWFIGAGSDANTQTLNTSQRWLTSLPNNLDKNFE